VTALLVALGAALGAPLRLLAAHHLDDDFPLGTLAVNVAGSFLLGLFSGLSLSGQSLAFLGVGFCGALTTYSAFAVQVAERVRREDSRNLGLLYALGTVVLAVGAAALGYVMGSS
jgi:fluoride exporter